ncbi:MAG: DUF6491 family protein [Gammaproteobacteria bacterium]|nr:DUF6491 family protein [Gammaproteobacteria bacterium]
MGGFRFALCTIFAIGLLCAGCAVSPEAESRRQAIEADIAAILSQPLDPATYGETKRCLAEREIRNFRALDDRRILFEGRGDKLWLNTLFARCSDLRFADTLRVKSFSWTSICHMDTFLAGDWFDWPWYRRWPWRWTSGWGMVTPCTLGQFQPVTAAQVGEIEAVLRSR